MRDEHLQRGKRLLQSELWDLRRAWRALLANRVLILARHPASSVTIWS